MAKLPPPKMSTMITKQNSRVPSDNPDFTNQPTDQPPPDSIKPIQIKIPESKKNEFKAYAAIRGKSMNTLFIDMFNEYKEKHK